MEIQEGLEIDRGYISPHFVTDTHKSVTEYENCRILVSDCKITDVGELVSLLEQIQKENQPLLIIADEISGSALATIIVNKMRGILQVVAVKTPGFGERRKALLQDIAIVTGAKFITKDLDMKISLTRPEQLGLARKVKVTSHACTILADQTNRGEINSRIVQIKKELERTDSSYEKEKLSERVAKLAGGVALIKVGGFTESEVEDRKLRIDDAKNATFAAMEEGIMPGGGSALIYLSEQLLEFKNRMNDDDEKLGVDIVVRAMRSPCRVIATNAGLEGEVIVESLIGKPFGIGYDAVEGEIGNLMEKGIIDPAKVIRNALQNSCSIAGIILTTQAVMSEPQNFRGLKRTVERYI